MENQLDQLKEARAALEKGVETKAFYRYSQNLQMINTINFLDSGSEFMETALSRGILGGKRFESMQALVDRCLALHDNRSSLGNLLILEHFFQEQPSQTAGDSQ